MKELHAEGLAIHGGPESWADEPRGSRPSVDRGTRRLGIEPRNRLAQRCRRRPLHRKATREGALLRAPERPLAVLDPMHVWNLSAREPGDPTTARGWHHEPQRASARSAESRR